ncbi:MAG: tetratricopeptide repeat protein, partial [Gemmatimonadota bacterium]|nr:tetratricopeptide repeat protein [Gemmatimonadota bacterium]
MAYSALIDDLEKQFAENPRRVFARLANEYRKAGDLERAIAYCRAHIPTAPSYISGYIVLGQALFESQRFEEARQAFETALNLDPENLIALKQLGDVARQNGDNESARAWYQRLLEVDPQNEEIAAQLETLAPRGRTESGSWWPSDNAVGWHGMMGASPNVPAEADASADAAHESLPELSMPDAVMPAQGDAIAEQEPLDQYVTESELFAAEGYATHVDPVGEDQIRGIEHFELGTNAAASANSSSLEESFAQADMSAFSRDGGADATASTDDAAEVSSVAPMYDPFVGSSSSDESSDAQAGAVTAGATPAFVTETMADLYLSQGFTGEAVKIYRQLVEQRPDDEVLRNRLAEVEAQLTA